MNTHDPPLAVIAGPTASGKSALALALSQRTNGVIVNADSAQVYGDLQILSARPSAGEMEQAEHRLFGHRDGAHACSAAEWAAEARAVIAQVHAVGRLPILVGGTGLYLRTLLHGIAEVPAIDPEVREAVRSASVADNHRRLSEHDPEAAARLHANDTTRVARALEVALATGRTLRDWQRSTSGGLADEVRLFGVLTLGPPDVLGQAIDRRFERMVDEGALDEVGRLLARDLSPALPVMRAIGVPELGRHLRGETTMEQAIEAGQLASRQYAKRQRTWFRNQPLGLDVEPDLEAALHRLLAAANG